MQLRKPLFLIVLAFACAPGLASAQVTTGTIAGRIVDQQNTAIPGVTITAVDASTGLIRTDTTNAEGTYRLAALPVGTYTVESMLPGFAPIKQSVSVDVGVTVSLDLVMKVANVAVDVSVTAATPLIPTQSSSLGEVVDLNRIEHLPLNGRQFANLAATVPGVGLGFHSDPAKAGQYVPQISGGNGRNVDYIVDGGDNNDDTVGGLLQQYPLEAIQEFNVLTHRFDAEYGRSDGGVLNVVTKSGTNALRGSWFTLLRDDSLNAQTESERINNQPKQPYRRYQYGGSVGGPIVRDKAHYFVAYERTQQDTKQIVNTGGLFPSEEGIFAVPLRENLFSGKVTASHGSRQYFAIRFAHDDNSQPTNVGLKNAHSSWAPSTNTFESLNANHSWISGSASLNEFVFQYSSFRNDIPQPTGGPTFMFASGVMGGANPAAPQITEQHKWQLRDDFSWTVSGLGVSHELRTGVNWIHEPTLFAQTAQYLNGLYVFNGSDFNSAIVQVLQIGGNVSGNIPLDLYGFYVQDDWRATDRLTLNLGLRYDYVDGMPIDQSLNPNFLAMQAAGATGRFAGTLLDDFGRSPRGDRNNVQPRLGAAFDVRGDGRDVVRGGWGIYTDFGYTNSNALTAALDAGGGGGIIFSAQSSTGLRKPDGTLFRATDAIDTISGLNTVDRNHPTSGEVVSPRLQEPFTYQTNAGWSHELSRSTAFSVDYVHVEGRDLNMRVRANTIVNGTPYLTGVGVQPNNSTFRAAVSKGTSDYNAMIAAIRRRMSKHVDVNASYTLAKATSTVGSASDELMLNLIQDIRNPYAPVQNGPSARTDARHRVTVSAIVEAPGGILVAPIVFYRSALPLHTYETADLNADGNRNDKTAVAYAYTGLNANGVATFEEIGPCETVNCSRRAPFSQVNLRISRSFRLGGSARIEAIGEVFNLFNAINPALPLNSARTTGFMQPSGYAGDAGQSEQRVGQIGFRVTF
jgi:hypothetical protein